MPSPIHFWSMAFKKAAAHGDIAPSECQCSEHMSSKCAKREEEKIKLSDHDAHAYECKMDDKEREYAKFCWLAAKSKQMEEMK